MSYIFKIGLKYFGHSVKSEYLTYLKNTTVYLDLKKKNYPPLTMWANRKSVDKDYETASVIRFQDRFKLVSLNNCSLALSLPKNFLKKCPEAQTLTRKRLFNDLLAIAILGHQRKQEFDYQRC